MMMEMTAFCLGSSNLDAETSPIDLFPSWVEIDAPSRSRKQNRIDRMERIMRVGILVFIVAIIVFVANGQTKSHGPIKNRKDTHLESGLKFNKIFVSTDDG
jgi:hypothetical protein